jgi:periplasmic divalent cation tolerance protein
MVLFRPKHRVTVEASAVITSEYALVLTTFPANSDAITAFARALVTERLAACVNILGSMESIYAWKGSIEQDQERQIVIKTTRGRLEALRARVHELHPYEVPEFLVIPAAGGSEAYLHWVSESTSAEW